jgi:hypothetical protein
MVRLRLISLIAASLALFCVEFQSSLSLAQTTTTGTTTTSTTGTTATTSTSNVIGAAGVVVDATGVLRAQFFPDHTGQTMRQKMAAARAAMAANNSKVATPSPLRKVSLNRLEAALKKQTEGGMKPTDEMKYLAGLTRVQYVFYYPDSKDIVIAGPAEGWATDVSGRALGATTGRPVIELDDLVTAMRAFPPGGKATSQISCSIDPTKEGLERMQEFVKAAHAKAGPGDMPAVMAGIRESLGPQTITIRGIPATTNFAKTIVEADYRMKLIGIGLERPPVRGFQPWIDRVNPTAVARNAIQRWYFVPNYECIRVTDDELGMEMVGDGVKLVGADEVVAPDGTRASATTIDGASRAWTEAFTKRYADIAAVAPVYGQLRNCIDLAVAAAFIQQKDYYHKAGWTMPVLGQESSYPVQTLNAPQQVDNIMNVINRGHSVMMPIGGGVEMRPRLALDPKNVLPDNDAKVSQVREKIELKNMPADQWWWD